MEPTDSITLTLGVLHSIADARRSGFVALAVTPMARHEDTAYVVTYAAPRGPDVTTTYTADGAWVESN
jgi:hypothetical protein